MPRAVQIFRNTTKVVILSALLLAGARASNAQASPPTSGTSVRGVAFDSLHKTSLRGAMISIDGTPHSAFTDSAGAFVFESLAPGTYAFTLSHPSLDSIGLSGVTNRVTTPPSGESLQLGVPSFGTLWSRACGNSPVPADSAFAFGTVRHSGSGAAVTGARVVVNYYDLRKDSVAGMQQRSGGGEVRTGADGSYVLCGLPTDLAITIAAEHDSVATDALDLPVTDEKIRRRDFLIGATNQGKVFLGTVRGVVKYRESGTAAIGARILASGMEEVRAGSRGEFTLTGVALGTRQLAVMAVGVSPTAVIVDVDTANGAPITIYLDRVTTLATRDINATRSGRRMLLDDMELRRQRRIGTFVDSLTEQRYSHTRDAFRLNTPGGVRRSEPCRVFVDGIDQQDMKPSGIAKIDPFWLVDPTDVAVMEFHARGTTAPIEFKPKGMRACDIVIIWTKHGLPSR